MHVTTCTDKLIPQLNPRRPTFLVDQRYQARTDRTRSIPHPPLPVNRDIGVHPTVNASTLRPAIVPGDKDALFSLLELATTRGVARMWNKKERREKGERERRKKEGRKEGRKSPRERRRPTPAHRHCERGSSTRQISTPNFFSNSSISALKILIRHPRTAGRGV